MLAIPFFGLVLRATAYLFFTLRIQDGKASEKPAVCCSSQVYSYLVKASVIVEEACLWKGLRSLNTDQAKLTSASYIKYFANYCSQHKERDSVLDQTVQENAFPREENEELTLLNDKAEIKLERQAQTTWQTT